VPVPYTRHPPDHLSGPRANYFLVFTTYARAAGASANRSRHIAALVLAELGEDMVTMESAERVLDRIDELVAEETK
jgi:hypothetical protein